MIIPLKCSSYSSIRITPLFCCLLFALGCYGTPSTTPAPAPLPAGAIEKRIEDVLQSVADNRVLSPDVQAAWQVLHGVLAFGTDFEIVVGPDQTRVPALDYLLAGNELRGWAFHPGQLFDNDRRGLRAVMDAGSLVGQGHPDQWLAVLSQANLPLDREIVVLGQSYQVRDWLAQVQWDVPSNLEREWSWTLIALTQYVPTHASWQANDGNRWSIEQLVESELDQELEASACGGTHRLIGIAMALNRRKLEGARIEGVWLRADEVLRQAAHYASEYQNADGSFSNNYFLRPGITSDNAQVLTTTGHVLELLALCLPADELRQPWMVAAVMRLCDVLEATKDLPLECGALYHAVHGLVIYRDRVFPAATE